jgi:hypothetical protein
MSLLGKVFGGIAKAAGGFLTGGPLGAAQAVLSKQKAAALPRFPADSIIRQQRNYGFGAFQSSTEKIYTQGPVYDGGGAGPYGGTQLPMLAAGAACPVGYRLNKSTYITRGGGTSRWGPAGSITVHPKGSTCVKRRRRNVGNARALRRAISRVKGFVKLARKAHSLVGPHTRKTKTKLVGPGTSIVNVD